MFYKLQPLVQAGLLITPKFILVKPLVTTKPLVIFPCFFPW